MKILDLVIIAIGLVVVSNITNYEHYNRVSTIKELEKAESGNYVISSYVQRGTLVDKPSTQPLQLLNTYNCEGCTGYGSIFITKRGYEYTINKFQKYKTVGGRYKVIAREGERYKAEKIGWIEPSFSVDNASYIEVLNNKYVGTN
jgi:hypothetical protein